jgi:hypothetical protein
MPDFLDEKRREILARLQELKPLVEEHDRLQAAADALEGVDTAPPVRSNGSAASPTPVARKRGRPRGSKNASVTSTSAKAAPAKAKGKGKPGRRRGTGARASQALTLVKEQPGITIPELAARMGIKQNYLYRVLPGLEGEGKVEKKARGWHPVEAA